VRHLALVKVEELPLGSRPLLFGTKGRDVKELQCILAELKLFDREPTGEYDYLTMEAVRVFQRRYHLPSDGRVGHKTIALLNEPGIRELIVLPMKEEDTLNILERKYRIVRTAFKLGENRRRIKQGGFCREIIVEKREVWTVSSGDEDLTGHGFSGFLKVNSEDEAAAAAVANKKKAVRPGEHPGNREKLTTFAVCLGKPREKDVLLEPGQIGPYFPRGLVYDLRNRLKMTKQMRKKASKEGLCRGIQTGIHKNPSLVFWWIPSPEKNNHYLPDYREADGIIISPTLYVAEDFTHRVWYEQIKKILRDYPCTRVLAHFHLEGLEETKQGVKELSTRESKALRRTWLGRGDGLRRRLGEDGWIYLRYSNKEEERAALIPDLQTLRALLCRVDRLNLAGVVFTGRLLLEEKLQTEFNRYFKVSSRRWS